MTTRRLPLWVAVAVAVSAAVAGWLFSAYICSVVHIESNAADRLNEFRATKYNLERDVLSKEQRELQKLRLYYIAARIPRDHIPKNERNFDFGAVDRTSTGSVRLHLFGHLTDREYEVASRVHAPTEGKLKRAP